MEVALLNGNETVINNELEIILKSRLLTFEGDWQLSEDVLASVQDIPALTVTYDYLVNIHDHNNLIYPDDLKTFLDTIESASPGEATEFTIRLINTSGEIKLLRGIGIFTDANGHKPSVANWDNYTNELDLSLRTFEYAEAVCSTGSWRWNLDTDAIYTSANFNRICGLHEGYRFTGWDSFLDFIHPKDRNHVSKSFSNAQQHFKSFLVKFRILKSDGSIRYITLKGKPFESRTQTNYLLGTIQDFTEYENFTQTINEQRTELSHTNELLQQQNHQLQESKELLESVIQSDIVALSVFKPIRNEQGEIEDFVWIMANKLMKAVAQGQNITGRRYTEIFPSVKEDGSLALLKKVMDTGKRELHEHYYQDKNIRGWFRSIYVRMHDMIIVSDEDVTLQKNAEQELSESKNRFEAAFNVSDTALSIVRAVRGDNGLIKDFAFEWLNKAASAMFGDITSEHSFLQILPQENRSTLVDLFTNAADNDIPVDTERQYSSEHENRWIRWKALKLGNGLFVSAEDITAQKKAQRELATLIGNTPDVITRWSKNLKLIFANTAFESKMGIPNAALYGKDNAEMGQPANIAHLWMDKLKKVFDTGEAETHYTFFPTRHGTLYFFTRIVPEKDINGEVETVLAIARDITELKKSEQELLKNFQILRQTEAVAGIGSWEFIPSQNEFTWSAGMYTLFGIPQGTEISPEIYQRASLSEDIPIAEKIVAHLRHDAQSFDVTMRIRASGKIKTLRIRASVIYDDNKLPWKILGVDFDITALTESERLKELNSKLKELDRAKTEFFSNVSHEFRTPLTLLLGPLEDILRSNTLQLHDRQRVEMVYRNSIRLQKLVNTLLDFSRIEAGRQEAFYQPTDIVSYTTDLASNFRSLIEKAGLKFNLKSKKIQEPVYVNRGMWEKIVLNLLSNAFKFTHRGFIEVEIRSLMRHITLHVRDTGIGISANNRTKIFDRFTRVEGAKARTYEGSGIGLALVKELVALHHGTIKVKSTEGIGTEFIITIPKGKAHLPASQIFENMDQFSVGGALTSSYLEEALGWMPGEKREAPNSLSTDAPSISQEEDILPTIVLVDDNADMRVYLAHLLLQDYKIIAVENGKKVLDLIYDGIRPDLILADVMMPEMDGHQMVTILKSNPDYAAIPVILLSARSDEDARIEGMRFGADDYLVKPFSSRELRALVHARIQIARIRQLAERELSNKNSELEHRVSERTQQLEESRSLIEKQNIHLQNILDAIPQMVWVMDADGKVKYINNRWYSYTGLLEEQCKIIAAKQSDIFHPDQQQEISAKWHASILNPGYYRGKVLIRNRDGEYRWHLDIMEPILNDAGDVEMWVGSFTDIHEQFLSEQQAKETSDVLGAILDSSTNAISVLDTQYDADGNVTDFAWEYFNRKALYFVGQKELQGKTIAAELPEAQAAILLQKFQQVIHTGMTTEFEYEVDNNGLKYWYQTIAVKLENRLVVTQQDITEKVKSRKHLVLLNESLKRKNYALKAMNDELANFAFIASHDLREPLRKIQLFTRELIEKEASVVTERGKTHAQKILNAVARMNALIDDVFAFSRASSVAVKPKPVNMQEQLEMVLGDLNETIEARQAAIEYTGLPVLRGNPLQLSQLLQNLVSNALKFQLPDRIPHVRISGSYISGQTIDSPHADRHTNYICIEVADNGIGFEDQYVERIFHMFQRLHVKTDFPGTGMGLAICKKIMHNHSGFITAKSVLGQGSVFSCYFPIQNNDAFFDNR